MRQDVGNMQGKTKDIDKIRQGNVKKARER